MKTILAFILALSVINSCSSPEENELQNLVDKDKQDTNDKDDMDPAGFSFSVDTIATGLGNPWGLTFLPEGDLLVTERSGEIRIIRNDVLLETRISGLPAIYARGQGGLFEIKLHPDYTMNGWLYLCYAAERNGESNTAVMRASLDGYELKNKTVIFQALPFLSGGQHFGGRVAFDAEGFLYITVGERGRRDNAQLLENHAGKIIRLNPDGSIPADNPFLNQPGVRPEIFAYGNRNPQGMAMHPQTGEIWTHEHGPMGGDEINIVRAGSNYGWPLVSYGDNYDGSTISDNPTAEGIDDPLHYWDPSIAPCGMTFVTSDLFGPWRGNLLVGSLKFRYLARLELEGNEVISEERLLEDTGRVRAVTEGPDGYIYLATESPGMVLRLRPAVD